MLCCIERDMQPCLEEGGRRTHGVDKTLARLEERT